MTNLKLAIALLVPIVFGVTIEVLHQQNHALISQINQKETELTLTKNELKNTQVQLRSAQNQLGFLEKNKQPVQVTAYTKPQNSKFANGSSSAYAVPSHTLPEDHMIYVALSPSAQSHLHVHMNDYLVLMQKKSHRKTMAKFVDVTAPYEGRAVVDVLFADQRQAILWGRKNDFYAINISSTNSPFKGVLEEHGKSNEDHPHRGQTG